MYTPAINAAVLHVPLQATAILHLLGFLCLLRVWSSLVQGWTIGRKLLEQSYFDMWDKEKL